MPRYNLPAGSKLFYTITSGQKVGKAERGRVRLLEFWVMRQSADSSVHVILRSSTTNYRVSEDGKRTESGPDIGWAYCDLHQDGRVADNPSLGDIDPRPLFVPLPADTVAAKQGWDRFDTTREESYHYRLDNKTLTDSIWLIREGEETPLDAAYQLSRSALIYLNTRRGLPVLREAEGSQAAGSGSGTATGTSKLDSVVRFDTVKVRPLLTDLETYFRADSVYTTLVDRAEADSLDRLLAQAETVLMDARLKVADTSLQGLIEDALVQHARIAEYNRHDAANKPVLEGKPAPDWQLEDFAGKKQTLKGFRGKVVLLDFWYVDCPWCIRAMPKLNALAERFKGKAVVVLGMNTDDSIPAAKQVLQRMKITYLSLKAKGVDKQYGVTGFPTLFVIDKKGVVRKVHIGYSKDMEETLAATVEQLLSGK
jgi:peroxiredoxin